MMVLKKFGDLVPGDVILGTDGQEVTVVEAYEEHVPESMYEIEMDNGETIKASGNHLWYVETDVDYQMHRQRRIIGKKLLKNIDDEKIKQLVEIAERDDENIVETSLIDMVVLVGSKDDGDIVSMLARVALAIGPIAESNVKYQDYETGEEIDDYTISVKHYDAVLFAQQILTLTGRREFKKKWNLVAGQVINTKDMLYMMDADINIPVVESKS